MLESNQNIQVENQANTLSWYLNHQSFLSHLNKVKDHPYICDIESQFYMSQMIILSWSKIGQFQEPVAPRNSRPNTTGCREFVHTVFLVNMARGLFVNFSVVGRDATIGFSFSAISVVWIDPNMNHTVWGIDEKHNGNHKIFAYFILTTQAYNRIFQTTKLKP